MRVELHPYRLLLKRPWIAASTILTERCGALLQLIVDDGIEGWGDCAPLPSGGNAEAVLAALRAWICRPASTDFSFPEVRWAVETAQADIAAQRQGVPLARHLNPNAPLDVTVNAALGPLDDGIEDRLRTAWDQGFRIGKIKVGLAPVEEEIERLKTLDRALDSSLRLRLDANRAWNDSDARRFLHAIADLPIDAVEEPLAGPTLSALSELQRALPYAIAIDESLPQFGIDAIVASRAVRRLVVKPARLGGITVTQAIARRAQSAGIEVVLTSVVDSAVGVAATAHLAAAIAPDQIHGLDTGNWLAADVAAAFPVASGNLRLPDTFGLGIRLR